MLVPVREHQFHLAPRRPRRLHRCRHEPRDAIVPQVVPTRAHGVARARDARGEHQVAHVDVGGPVAHVAYAALVSVMGIIIVMLALDFCCSGRLRMVVVFEQK